MKYYSQTHFPFTLLHALLYAHHPNTHRNELLQPASREHSIEAGAQATLRQQGKDDTLCQHRLKGILSMDLCGGRKGGGKTMW